MKNKEKGKTFTFSFSSREIKALRRQSNNDYNCISEIKVKSGKSEVSFWNQYCAILYRIDETIDYLNTLKLATKKYQRHAFDLYAFISQADVIVQAVRLLGKTFKMEEKMGKITGSTSCFGNARFYTGFDNYFSIKTKGNDGKFWEYLRSITTIHPNETSKSNFLQSVSTGDKSSKVQKEFYILNVSPYTMWQQYTGLSRNYSRDIDITVYLGDNDSSTCHLTVDMKMIVNYMNKWLSFLNDITIKINELKVARIDRLKKTVLKDLNDFQGNIPEFLEYLELEYKRRYHPDLSENDIENFFSKSIIRFFETEFDDPSQQKVLNKFLNSLLKKVKKLRNSIQNMEEDPDSVLIISPYMIADERKFPISSDFVYSFDKLEYIDVPYVVPNEDYQQSDLEKEILDAADQMINEGKSVSEIRLKLSRNYWGINLGDEMWGRLQAYLIAKMLLKENSIDFTLNHWKVYVQLVLAFWKKKKSVTKKLILNCPS